MQIHVKVFAGLREQLGFSARVVDVPPGTTIGQLPALLAGDRSMPAGWPGTLLYALNRRYVTADAQLSDASEVALLPPLGGG